MKIRYGFVSNSSSSSFIVSRDDLSKNQIDRLFELCDSPIGSYRDEWSIRDSENETITGFTYMNNGQDEDGLEAWLRNNDYPLTAFMWEHD